MHAWLASSRDVERHAVHDVVMVAGRIGDERRRLGLPDDVAGARHHRELAALGRDREAERAEREAPEILAERRLLPGLAAVGRHLDRADAVAAVPRDAADRDGAG